MSKLDRYILRLGVAVLVLFSLYFIAQVIRIII